MFDFHFISAENDALLPEICCRKLNNQMASVWLHSKQATVSRKIVCEWLADRWDRVA